MELECSYLVLNKQILHLWWWLALNLCDWGSKFLLSVTDFNLYYLEIDMYIWENICNSRRLPSKAAQFQKTNLVICLSSILSKVLGRLHRWGKKLLLIHLSASFELTSKHISQVSVHLTAVKWIFTWWVTKHRTRVWSPESCESLSPELKLVRRLFKTLHLTGFFSISYSWHTRTSELHPSPLVGTHVERRILRYMYV